MDLQTIIDRYHARFLDKYGSQTASNQRSAINAILGCRQGQYGDLLLDCQNCPSRAHLPRSCGHRSCNQCQSQSTMKWLERQLQKQLPVNYYMATFTLPYELRSQAKAHPAQVYNALMNSASSIIKRFGSNKKGLSAEMGMCAVLHTHTRKLDYHPHVHVVIPGGGIDRARRQWRKIQGNYLFNGRALAKAFRGECLNLLAKEGLTIAATPKKWIVHCQKVGRGKEALQYLSRYLYRGVISNKQILDDDGTHVTFRYRESKTKTWRTRKERGEDFIKLLLQHVLPKGFRRARDYGFLHGNAKAILRIVQWVLKVERPKSETKKAFTLSCSRCNGIMHVVGIRPARASPA